MPQIVIVVHRYDRFEDRPYFLREIANVWRTEGLDVRVVEGTRRVDADIALMHVDLTVVPRRYQALAHRYPLVLNGEVTDISKRRVSANLVERGDGVEGPVIVKTDLNCCGDPEVRLALKRIPHPLRWLREPRERLLRRGLPAHDYQVYESSADVPETVWRDARLVVERFLPERRGQEYCLRTWMFLGDRETNSACYSPDPIIKSSNFTRREPVDEVPAELRRMRQELGFDFGKFDYAIVDGRVVLYDANRTPSLGRFQQEQYTPRVRLLAEGIRSYL